MHRPRPSLLVPLVVSLPILAALACSNAPEQPILNHFFTASRLRDKSSLDSFATAVFEPRTDGTVQTFSITSVTPEQRTPLTLKSLQQVFDAADAEDTAFNQRKVAYQDANLDAIKRVLAAEDQKSELKGKDLEVQAEWAKFREEGMAVHKKLTEARDNLAAATRVVELSVQTPGTPVDVSNRDGDLVSKDVTISARVRQPDGQTVQKTLVVTMQKAELKGDNVPADVRWVITAVKAQPS